MKDLFVVRWLFWSAVIFLSVAGFSAFLVYVPYAKEIILGVIVLGMTLFLGWGIASLRE